MTIFWIFIFSNFLKIFIFLNFYIKKNILRNVWWKHASVGEHALYDSDFAEFEFSRADTVSLDNVKGSCNIFERRRPRGWKSIPCSCAVLVTEVTNENRRFYEILKVADPVILKFDISYDAGVSFSLSLYSARWSAVLEVEKINWYVSLNVSLRTLVMFAGRFGACRTSKRDETLRIEILYVS